MMLLDSTGRAIRRRIGFVDGYEPESRERPEVSAVGWQDIPAEEYFPLIENRHLDPK